jgi:uncharacterized protein (TIGR02300 family)
MTRGFDSALAAWQGAPHFPGQHPEIQDLKGKRQHMVKPEWGTKRACPKCGTRFYDLTKDEPVVCISCSYSWDPEPILKSKQPLPFEVVKKESEKPETEDGDLGDEDLDIGEDDEPSPDDDVDLGGDDDLGVETGGDEDEQ